MLMNAGWYIGDPGYSLGRGYDKPVQISAHETETEKTLNKHRVNMQSVKHDGYLNYMKVVNSFFKNEVKPIFQELNYDELRGKSADILAELFKNKPIQEAESKNQAGIRKILERCEPKPPKGKEDISDSQLTKIDLPGTASNKLSSQPNRDLQFSSRNIRRASKRMNSSPIKDVIQVATSPNPSSDPKSRESPRKTDKNASQASSGKSLRVINQDKTLFMNRHPGVTLAIADVDGGNSPCIPKVSSVNVMQGGFHGPDALNPEEKPKTLFGRKNKKRLVDRPNWDRKPSIQIPLTFGNQNASGVTVEVDEHAIKSKEPKRVNIKKNSGSSLKATKARVSSPVKYKSKNLALVRLEKEYGISKAKKRKAAKEKDDGSDDE